MARKVAMQGASRQVFDHGRLLAQIEQAAPGMFQAGVLPEELAVGTVGQIKQGET
ncbi:hypothetical protein D3C80_1742110 [compost metagenome]